MHVVGSRQLRPRLGEYLERGKDGDEVVVLVHRQLAALLRPVLWFMARPEGFEPPTI
jgi:antitoxin (DNA-binding transcriptional repressor) of toxin-antitoxin stability system